jgi:hypothetical protein
VAALSPRRLTATTPIAALACLLFALVGATAARAETVSFGFTGSEQTLPIPAGITSVHVVAVGGRGGTGTGNVAAGGFGARVSADLVVTPGQIPSSRSAASAATVPGSSVEVEGSTAVAKASAAKEPAPPVAEEVAPPTCDWSRAPRRGR